MEIYRLGRDMNQSKHYNATKTQHHNVNIDLIKKERKRRRMSRQVKERVLNQIESGKCQRCGREILSRPDVSPSHSCKLEDIRNHLASFPPEKKEVGK